MRILVTGAGGQLGAAAARAFAERYDVVALSRRELDVTDAGAVTSVVATVKPDVVLNAAAYNDVDGAEENALTALRVNAFAVQLLAAAAERTGAALIHYGTDFVFDGDATSPYTENDRPNPRSVYAASKLLGELFAASVKRHYVLRVESLFGGPVARSSIGKILDALERGSPVRAFSDRTLTPSFVDDVLAATEGLLASSAPSGVYHAVASGVTNWHELALAAAHRLGREELVTPVFVNEVPMRAPRPIYCALSNEKLARLGITMPAWRDALERHLAMRAG